MGGRLARVALVVAVLVGLLLAWEPSRVALQTAVLLPNLLGAGPQPLSLLSASPIRTPIEYRPVEAGRDPDLAELWLPAWASPDRPAGAMLLVLGVNNVGRNHPVVARVADGLARTGVAVLVPDSRTLISGRLDVGEIDGVVHAFQTLAGRPEVDPDRVGMVGFSVGAALALIAASDARIADDVRWINSFGAYADAAEYLASAAAHAYEDADGDMVEWLPSDLARQVYVQFVLDQVVDAGDRAALDGAYRDVIEAGDRAAVDDELRDSLETDAGRAAYDLLTVRSLAEAREAIAALPLPSRLFVAAISPVRHMDGLRADTYVMHERDDHHVPFVQSRALSADLEERGRLVTYTEFRLFDHVQPDDLDLVAAAPELWKLLWHVHALMVETL